MSDHTPTTCVGCLVLTIITERDTARAQLAELQARVLEVGP